MPSTNIRSTRRRLAALVALSLFAAGAMGQTLSKRPITLVVPFGAGSGADAIGRVVGEALSKQLGTAVVIDNKPGALGQIAVNQVRTSAPDGHTLLLGEPGVVLFYPLAKKPTPFDPRKDLAHVSLIADSGLTWLVPAQRGYKSVKEYVEVQKKKDKAMLLTVALAAHVATSLFADTAGFKYEPIPIRNAGDVIPLLASGEAEGVFVTNAYAAAQIAGGRVVGLMQTGESRAKVLPDVPTSAEAGFPAVNAPSWMSVQAPAATPAPIIQQLNNALTAVIREPAVRQKLETMGFVPLGTSADVARTRITKEYGEWKAIVDKANISVP